MQDSARKQSLMGNRFANLGSDGAEVRLGLMGGTFDPIHIAHLAIAERARVQLGLDAVLFIPTGNPVFKKGAGVTDAHVRLEMVRRAVAGNPYFDVSAIEVERAGDTYTVDTLRQLRALYPENVSLYFITGADAAAALWKWRGCEEVARLAHVVVASRAGVGLNDDQIARIMEAGPFRLHFVDVPALDIASTAIRERSRNDEPIRYLVPEEVYAAIREYGLYQTHRSCSTDDARAACFIENGLLGFAEHDADALGDAFFAARDQQLKQRVKNKRYVHVMGVVDAAKKMASVYNVDESKAKLAALLHDWDKGFTDEAIRARARELDVPVDARVYDDMPQLLHGPTAAKALQRAYPQIPSDVLQAIERHTAGACGMSDLDMVVYTADAIEANRDFPGVESLRKLVGETPLEELFVKTFSHTFKYLLEQGKTIHPATVDIWNHYNAHMR